MRYFQLQIHFSYLSMHMNLVRFSCDIEILTKVPECNKYASNCISYQQNLHDFKELRGFVY